MVINYGDARLNQPIETLSKSATVLPLSDNTTSAGRTAGQ